MTKPAIQEWKVGTKVAALTAAQVRAAELTRDEMTLVNMFRKLPEDKRGAILVLSRYAVDPDWDKGQRVPHTPNLLREKDAAYRWKCDTKPAESERRDRAQPFTIPRRTKAERTPK